MKGVAVVQKQEEWWSRETAATYLGVDVRKLRKLCQGGRIRRQHVPPGPGRPYQSMVYLAADVVTYKSRAAAGDGSSGVPWVRPAEPASALPAAITMLAQQLAPAPRVKRWLTLDEAVGHSGIPRAFLKRLARKGGAFGIEGACINVGTPARPRWRFDRDAI